MTAIRRKQVFRMPVLDVRGDATSFGLQPEPHAMRDFVVDDREIRRESAGAAQQCSGGSERVQCLPVQPSRGLPREPDAELPPKGFPSRTAANVERLASIGCMRAQFAILHFGCGMITHMKHR